MSPISMEHVERPMKVQLRLIPVQSRRAERCRGAIANVLAAKQACSVVGETERGQEGTESHKQ